MSIVKLTFSPVGTKVSLGVMGNNELLDANEIERIILQNLVALAWQNAKTRKEYNAAQALVDEVEALPADAVELSLSREDVERIVDAWLSTAEKRPIAWRIAGRALLKQLTTVRE